MTSHILWKKHVWNHQPVYIYHLDPSGISNHIHFIHVLHLSMYIYKYIILYILLIDIVWCPFSSGISPGTGGPTFLLPSTSTTKGLGASKKTWHGPSTLTLSWPMKIGLEKKTTKLYNKHTYIYIYICNIYIYIYII